MLSKLRFQLSPIRLIRQVTIAKSARRPMAIASLLLGLGMITLSSSLVAQQPAALRLVEPDFQQHPLLGKDQQLWGRAGKKGDYVALLRALDHSLRYLNTAQAAQVYRRYPLPGFTRDRVRRSLQRFRQLVRSASSPEDLQRSVAQEFAFYQAIGNDQRGTVLFTGYFEPTYLASRQRTHQFRYPLYRLPPNFSRWSKPHPTRSQLEGADGQGRNSRLAGQELVWLSDRLEAFLVQVQGSARLQLTDGSTLSIGYAGNTDYPYTSLGRQLVDAGIFTLEELTLPLLIDYFRAHPDQLNQSIPRNNRFIFFRATHGAPPTGSIGVPVTGDRSIATDKSLMPPGALAILLTQIPSFNGAGQLESQLVSRYVLDQDTGSAIKGPGRVDIFLGSGNAAGDRAGLMNHSGTIYYLLLK